ETGPGWVCANAGIDESNAVQDGQVTLLPRDPDASAEGLRTELRSHLRVDLRGTRDLNGHELRVTVIGVADELACAAGLVMGKAEGVAAVIVRGYRPPTAPAALDADRPRGGRALIRRRENDLFR